MRSDDGPVAPRGGDGAVSPLKQARVDREFSLRDVSEQIGVAFSHISALEHGTQRNPSLKVARALSRLYGKSIDELFPEQEQQP